MSIWTTSCLFPDMRYAGLIGRVNVGKNRLSMADLREAMEREGFANVETVVASGNVLFDHDERPSAGIADKLAHLVAERFGFDTFAVVLTREELAAAIDASPFKGEGEDKQVHTVFLDGDLDPIAYNAMIAAYQGRGPERIEQGRRAVHVDFVDGVSQSRLTPGFIERRLGVAGTARNRRSLQRILDKMA